MVEQYLAKVQIGVRFSVSAQSSSVHIKMQKRPVWAVFACLLVLCQKWIN